MVAREINKYHITSSSTGQNTRYARIFPVSYALYFQNHLRRHRNEQSKKSI